MRLVDAEYIDAEPVHPDREDARLLHIGVGHDALLAGASYAVNQLLAALDSSRWPALPLGPVSQDLHVEIAFAEYAVGVAIARLTHNSPEVSHPRLWFDRELRLIERLEDFSIYCPNVARRSELGRWVGTLWQSVRTSGVLSQLPPYDGRLLWRRQLECDAQARLQAAHEALKCCALAGCGAKEQHLTQFSRCSSCRASAYCCKQHRDEDWPNHRGDACKAARKAATAARKAARAQQRARFDDDDDDDVAP